MPLAHERRTDDPGHPPALSAPNEGRSRSLAVSLPPELSPRLTALVLAAIVLLALALRVVHLRDLPAGLHCDEAAFGYNAWALLHHGMDENGESFPLFLWSFWGYKNPVFLYAAMLPIGLLGLDEFSLRLTSALFGTATVLALFFLGRALFGNVIGLLSAALLSVCPWHIHFSRIAYELISFPLLFVVGLTLLVRFTQGRRTLAAACLFLGGCLYAYAVAKLFVPLFLLGFAALFRRQLWARRREAALAAAVLMATVTPVFVFDALHRDRSGSYFRDTSILRPGTPPLEVAGRFLRNYGHFVGPRFLFRQGDPMARHAVRNHGELYSSWAPFLLLGLVSLSARALARERAPALILVWLALYPAGASLMNEIPSASRGFIGAAAFCLVTALGLATSGTLLARLHPRLPLAGLAVFGAVLAAQTARYLRLYARDYPTYSAAGYVGFQYGYRELVQAMEPERSRYATLLWTATEVNEPYILALFHRPLPPALVRATHDPGFLILDPAEYGRYRVPPPALYALREHELGHFPGASVKRRVVAPGGQVEFVIAEVRERKRYLTAWSVLGPSPALAEGLGFASPAAELPRLADTALPWKPCRGPFVRADLRECLAPDDPKELCAYAATTVRSASARPAFLELGGAVSFLSAWWNGAEAGTFGPATLAEAPRRFPVQLRPGENELVVGACLRHGDWAFQASLLDELGRNLEGLEESALTPSSAARR